MCLNFVIANMDKTNIIFNERKNKSCINKNSKSQESLFKNVHVLSYENVNNPKRILNNNTCKYYNRQSLPEYKNKNCKKMYKLAPIKVKNTKINISIHMTPTHSLLILM